MALPGGRFVKTSCVSFQVKHDEKADSILLCRYFDIGFLKHSILV